MPTQAPVGLSPRVRGNLYDRRAGAPRQRSIPACTGEPRDHAHAEGWRRVYPRVYGGTTIWGAGNGSTTGLSPRVRGNQVRADPPGRRQRSIPACTGEPILGIAFGFGNRVYPRVYGGTSHRLGARRRGRGLSPRVRGNPRRARYLPQRGGSIPACTGEPRFVERMVMLLGVYPRVYGGTAWPASRGKPDAGLSPRVRGNHRTSYQLHISLRSIPACTGEPPVCPPTVLGKRVYPRVYGGTFERWSQRAQDFGLSPRVRGNRSLSPEFKFLCGSIPACTGEPERPRGRRGRCGVYPRVYGGTAMANMVDLFPQGLSPRVRGNRLHLLPSEPLLRSIPACTGEPSYPTAPGLEGGVYPRVYGGTAVADAYAHSRDGLSPRVRGNLPLRGHPLPVSRSIPACTGEPRQQPRR